MNEKEKKLEELLNRFFESQGREEVKWDILRGDEILSGFVTPEPKYDVLEAIKLRVSEKLEQKRSAGHNRMVFLRSFAAAMILIAVMLGVQFMQHEKTFIDVDRDRILGGVPMNWGDDGVLDALSAEVGELEDSFIRIRLDESGIEENSDMAELEYEMMEIAGDFWKG